MNARTNEVKKRRVNYHFDGKDLELVMGLSAVADLQDKYGDLEAAFSDVSVKTLISIATILINDAIEEHNEICPSDKWRKYGEREVGRLIGMEDVPVLKDAIFATLGISLPATAEGDEPSDKMKAILDDIDIGEASEKNAQGENNDTQK